MSQLNTWHSYNKNVTSELIFLNIFVFAINWRSFEENFLTNFHPANYNSIIVFSIARNPKSTTKNPILIKLACTLNVTVVHVCAKNGHGVLSTILTLTITICSIFRKRKLHRIAKNPKSATKNPMLIKLYMHVKCNHCPCVCKKLTRIIKYYFDFDYNNLLNFSKTRTSSHR